MFTAALFAVAKTWKNTQVPINGWLVQEEVVYMYYGILHSH